MRSAIQSLGQFSQSLRLGEKDVSEHLLRCNVLKITRAKALHQLLVIRTFHESSAANHRQFPFGAHLDRFGKTSQARVTLVLDRSAGLRRPGMSSAAIRIAKLDVFR